MSQVEPPLPDTAYVRLQTIDECSFRPRDLKGAIVRHPTEPRQTLRGRRHCEYRMTKGAAVIATAEFVQPTHAFMWQFSSSMSVCRLQHQSLGVPQPSVVATYHGKTAV
jgi:hypothetical protein